MRCRRPRSRTVSKTQMESLGNSTYVHANPDAEDRVSGSPFRETSCLRALQVQVHLVDEREHRRSERRHELRISCCATAGEIVRVHGAGVELCDVVAYPVWASRSGPARESWVAERVGRRCQAESWVEASLGVAVAAVLWSAKVCAKVL